MKIFDILKKFLFLFFIIVYLRLSAQEKIQITDEDYNNEKVEMADTMRSNGKIYIVVAVVLIILLGMIGYLTVIDRKISKLEKENK